MPEKAVTIVNKLGMHLRAAAVFIEQVNKFRCEVYLCKDGRSVNAKSIMGLLTLGAAYGTTVTVKTQGENEGEALAALVNLINNRFGERD